MTPTEELKKAFEKRFGHTPDGYTLLATQSEILKFVAEREALAERRGVEKAWEIIAAIEEGISPAEANIIHEALLTPDNKHKI